MIEEPKFTSAEKAKERLFVEGECLDCRSERCDVCVYKLISCCCDQAKSIVRESAQEKRIAEITRNFSATAQQLLDELKKNKALKADLERAREHTCSYPEKMADFLMLELELEQSQAREAELRKQLAIWTEQTPGEGGGKE